MNERGTPPAAGGAIDEGDDARGAIVVSFALVAALGGFLFGYDSAVINGAIIAIGSQFHASAGALGLTVSSALVGAAAGALIAGRVGDHYGRLAAMRIASILFVVSALGSGLAPSLVVLALFRVIGGVAVGMASVIAPTYIAEIAPAGIRGRLGSLQQLAIVSGIFLSLLVDYAIAATAGNSRSVWIGGLEAWRWMFIAMVVPALTYGTLSLTIPESPRQLLAKGRIAEAQAVLKRVLGERGLDAKITRIRTSISRDKEPSWLDLRGPAFGLLPVVWIGIGLSVFQQVVGINVIFYYSSVLWQAVGFSEKNSLIITVITSVVNVVTTIVAISLVDRWGRRPLLLVGSAGMAVTLGILAFVFGSATLDTAGQPHLTGANGIVALVAANVYVFAFGMSWGPVVWVLLGEKFPNRIRAAALGVAAAAQWIANWAITTSFPILKNAGLGIAYGMYATFAVLSFFFVWRFVTETKGRELEENDRELVPASANVPAAASSSR
ncbi:MAG: sugar porter family MFS transporter [Candidatus Eremiobacteraeota bacterium]|nr:sugar porter family MFS transporter [Candidatus Eremiobacteraeota bacterium]